MYTLWEDWIGGTETLHEDDEARETDILIGHIRAMVRSKVTVQRLLSVYHHILHSIDAQTALRPRRHLTLNILWGD
jgi:hypothetical protein